MATRIILDTDIGTDVDDCLALAVILASPEVSLDGITCVYGDVALRARIVRKLLQLRGISGVPVLTGARRPLLGLRPVYWEGHEGQGILSAQDDDLAPDPGFAPDFIARTILDNPGQIHLVCIGPLTNLALAIQREPALGRHLAHLTIMGGVVRGLSSLELPVAEHNIMCDPEAAHIVFTCGAPTSIVPLDITVQVSINLKGLDRIQRADTPFHAAVAGQLERYPRFHARGETSLHDPLAAATVIAPDLVEWRPVHVAVETSGRHTSAATIFRALEPGEVSPIRLAVGVDVARAAEFILSRLER